jgi:RES domain-containing protein
MKNPSPRSSRKPRPEPPSGLPAWAQLFRDGGVASPSDEAELPEPPPDRIVSGHYFRHVAPRSRPLDVRDPAPANGRYHRRGSPAPLYASSTEESAWAELFRHTEPGISPFEVKRRMCQLEVRHLHVLDLTDPDIRDALGVTERNLTSNRLTVCQQIAAFARRWPDHLDGILAPSAAVPGLETLVIFPEGLGNIGVVTQKIANPPWRLLYLFERVIATLPPRAQDAFYSIARQVRRELLQRLRHP